MAGGAGLGHGAEGDAGSLSRQYRLAGGVKGSAREEGGGQRELGSSRSPPTLSCTDLGGCGRFGGGWGLMFSRTFQTLPARAGCWDPKEDLTQTLPNRDPQAGVRTSQG